MKGSQISVGVIGARRARHGIGPFVAAHLNQLGANVSAIACTSSESVALAQRELLGLAGISPRGYTNVPEMLDNEQLDAVAICSPDAAHEAQLRLALDSGLHVLCEKPLIFDGTSDPAKTASPIAAGFAERGLVLAVNEQWPYTLPAFDSLFPDVLGRTPPQSFRMLLCPGATGVEMIPNSLPHVLSMLFALHGEAAADSADLSNIKTTVVARNEYGEASAARLEFDFSSQVARETHTTRVATELHFAANPPRPAAFSIDGHGVSRVIRDPGYQMFLERLATADGLSLFAAATQSETESSGGSLRLKDPLQLLLVDFLQQCQQPTAAANIAAVRSLHLLWQLYLAAQANSDFAKQHC